MKTVKNHISKKILAVGAVTAFLVVILLLKIFSGQTSQTIQQAAAGTAEYEESSKEELLQELYYVSDYLDQMDTTVLTNQESLSTIANTNETFLSQSEALAQKISQIEENLNKFLLLYGTDEEEIRNRISEILADLEEARERLNESNTEIVGVLAEMEDMQKNGQEKMQKDLEKILSTVSENTSDVKEKLEQSYENLSVVLNEMKEEKTADQEEVLSFMEETNQELGNLIVNEAEQLALLIEAEGNYIQLMINSEVQYLSGRMGDLHVRIAVTQDELSLLLHEMKTGGEVRHEDVKETLQSVKESLTLIQTDFATAQDEVKSLLDEVKQSADEKQSELVLVLSQMETEMEESSQMNFTLLMESMNQMSENYMESISRMNENHIESFAFLKGEMDNSFQGMGADVSEQINTLNSKLSNQYENLTTMVSTGNDDLRVYLDNIYGEVNQKLDSVFTYVSSGKRLLASALLTKGVSCREDATFHEIYQALISVPQELDIGTQEIHGTVSYDYHYHVNGAGTNPHTERQEQMGGCYVTPVYHVHSGSSISGGGCYSTRIYHTHTGSSTAGGGCYSVPIAHTHSSSCPTKKVIANGGSATSCDGTFMYQSVGVYKCSRCGASSSSGGTCKAYNPHYETVYDCSKTVDGYNLGCGKSASTIESFALGCGKSTSTVDYYNAGCGFIDGQIIGVHIIYSRNRAKAAVMNLRIDSGQEIIVENEVPKEDSDIEADILAEESIEQEEVSDTGNEAEEIGYKEENDVKQEQD